MFNECSSVQKGQVAPVAKAVPSLLLVMADPREILANNRIKLNLPEKSINVTKQMRNLKLNNAN